jgi:GrpB-like predicted nucleotidyltransferase (UPF0157 family)
MHPTPYHGIFYESCIEASAVPGVRLLGSSVGLITQNCSRGDRIVRKVEVVPHNSQWRAAFEAEAKLVAAALGENVVAIHHIGSTAIPNIYAKPIIDLLVEVRDITEVDGRSSAMGSLGYEAMGEFGIPGRRYFRRDNQAGVRTHQIHVFEAGSAEVERHITFRDYMIAHPGDAQRYSELKRKLAEEHPQNMDGYMDGKDGFIKQMDQKAARWRALQSGSQPAA